MAVERYIFEEEQPSSQTKLTSFGSNKGKSGCHVSGGIAFILLLLAILVAVVVGIIVHFAGGGDDIVCQCEGVVGASASTVLLQCMVMAARGNMEICSKCPAITTATTTTATTTTATTAAYPGTTLTPTLTPATVSTSTTTPSDDEKNVRLPDSVYPIHYDIELQPYMHRPNPADFTFRGSVRILVECRKITDRIILNTNVLQVDPSSIRFYQEVPPVTADIRYMSSEADPDRQFFIIKLTKNMTVNSTYFVEMNFTSPLTNNLKGLYYSQYTKGNQTIYLAASFFSPTDARKAFPCFDEPYIKATFNVTLVRPSDRISISNMPLIDSNQTFVEDEITYVKDVFEQTPKMSTYLLAFVVCDFDYTSNTTKNGVAIRAWATPETVNQTLYALGLTVEILPYYEDFFQVEYPLPKQDMFAVPDFAAGAMENWGLIIYRETNMLYQPGVSNEENKERVNLVVSHELAHQWFGNLVTPSWWDDLWLKEGFASFMMYLGMDFVQPNWKMFDKFVVEEVQAAFSFDGLVSSHPIYVPVGNPNQINEIFDTISYDKSPSIIRMMRHFLGYETFRKGMMKYLTRLAYGAAFHDDLWQALSDQAEEDEKDIDVKAVMDTWTLQMNFPVVTVTRDSSDPDLIRVTQERYLADAKAPDPGKYESPFNYKWTIPLTLTSSRNPNFNQTDEDVLWIDRTETSKAFSIGAASLPETTDDNGWILANTQQNGYYRVNYDTLNWNALCNQLKVNHQLIPVTNRAQILNDAWNLAKSGHINLETALKTTEYLEHERDYVPWYAAREELNYVNTMLSFHSLYGPFQRFMRSKVNSTYHFFGLNNTGADHDESYVRSLIAKEACKYGIKDCQDAARAQYKQWMDNPSVNPIDPNLKSLVYCYAIGSGGWSEWSFGLKMYNEVNVATEKANLLSALACSSKPWILNHYLGLTIEKNSPIRNQDALDVVSKVASNTIGRSLAWSFFRGNYEILRETYGSAFFAWTRVIDGVTSDFNTEFDLQEVTRFKTNNEGNLGTGERAFEQAVEKISANIKWMETNIPILERWFKDTGY